MANQPMTVDGVAIPTPTTLKVNIEDLSSEATGRTLDGYMHKDVVAEKRYLDCTWKKLTGPEAALLLATVKVKTQVTVRFPDPYVPSVWQIGNFYVGKRTCTAKNLGADPWEWGDISFTFTEI